VLSIRLFVLLSFCCRFAVCRFSVILFMPAVRAFLFSVARCACLPRLLDYRALYAALYPYHESVFHSLHPDKVALEKLS